jgi:glutathione S-transferase
LYRSDDLFSHPLGAKLMHFTALITLASLLFYASIGFAVAQARARCKVQAPATTGDPAFERIYRVQMNTLEWLPIYIPCLWLFGFFVSDLGAAALGVVWIFGRYLYRKGYEEAPQKRGRGFVIQATATAVLLVGSAFDIIYRMATGQ